MLLYEENLQKTKKLDQLNREKKTDPKTPNTFSHYKIYDDDLQNN